ncbi:MAG: transcription antitermination factor NusB [Anaerolineae bacterium]|nr:transcription antitermination factor NusB [Anaerolineae bacterium]
MKSRTKARSIALRALYELDQSTHEVGTVMENLWEMEENLDVNIRDFSLEIVSGVYPIIHDLDIVIAEHAPEWPMEQVAVIDRNILRIAAWEFAVSKRTPLKVAINEAIELAKVFGSDSTPRFVNGVLGSLANKQNEIYQKFLTHES